MKYELTLNGRTYEVEVELAEPMMMQEFQSRTQWTVLCVDGIDLLQKINSFLSRCLKVQYGMS